MQDEPTSGTDAPKPEPTMAGALQEAKEAFAAAGSVIGANVKKAVKKARRGIKKAAKKSKPARKKAAKKKKTAKRRAAKKKTARKSKARKASKKKAGRRKK